MTEQRNKRIVRKYRGKLTYVDDAYWKQLKVDDCSSSFVLFRDNNDGTASLTGNLTYLVDHLPVINPPEGYQFSNLDSWRKSDNYSTVTALENGSDVTAKSMFLISGGKIACKKTQRTTAATSFYVGLSKMFCESSGVIGGATTVGISQGG